MLHVFFFAVLNHTVFELKLHFSSRLRIYKAKFLDHQSPHLVFVFFIIHSLLGFNLLFQFTNVD